MRNTLAIRETACSDEKLFCTLYNEFIRRVNANYSTGYVAAAWRKVRNAYEYYSATSAEWLKHFSICVSQRIIKALTPRRSCVSGVTWNCDPIEKNCEQLYLIELLNARGELVWSKVGTTTRSTEKRMEEHLRYYKKYGITAVRVLKVWECDTDAEGFESFFRSYYIRKHPGSFQKNDRFHLIEFDLDEADRLFAHYQRFNQI